METDFLVVNERDQKFSVLNSFILFLSFMMGMNLLVQSYAFREGGILLTLVEYLVIGYLSYQGACAVIDSAQKRKIFDFGLLAKDICGIWGEIGVELSISFSNIGCLLSYFIIMSSLLQDFVESYSDSSVLSNIYLLNFFCFVVMLPFCLRRIYGELLWVAVVSLTLVSAIALLVLVDGPLSSASHENNSLTWFNLSGGINTIGFVIVMFSYTPIVCHTFTTMSSPNIQVLHNITLAVTVMGGALCVVTGLVGYISFRNATLVNIISNFTGNTALVYDIVVVVHLLSYVPGVFVVVRHSLLTLCGVHIHKLSSFTHEGVSVVMLFTLVLISAILNVYLGSSTSLTLVINISGGVGSTLSSFIFPGIFAVVDCEFLSMEWINGCLLIFFGGAISVVVVYSVILSVL